MILCDIVLAKSNREDDIDATFLTSADTGTNTSEFVFGQVMTPEGILTVRVRYRPAVQVEVNEHERMCPNKLHCSFSLLKS
jgi:hypothetical protein